jgi:hypothetical protein
MQQSRAEQAKRSDGLMGSWAMNLEWDFLPIARKLDDYTCPDAILHFLYAGPDRAIGNL